MIPHVEDRIRALPDRPGIYVFRDGGGKPLYVGKAKSLRRRAAHYLRQQVDPRLRAMAAEAAEVESVVTDTEAEALLLENNWIKRHRPRYNVLLRDDKTYPYLKLTLQEEYPRLAFTRRVAEDGAAYFGPFLPGGLARRAIKLVQKLFQVRVCHIAIDGSLPRPCLYHDMHRCLGPCVSGLTSREAYGEAVEQARLFLAGRNDELLRRLKREMEAAAAALEFERAARLRDALREVEGISQRRKLSSVQGEDVDVYGYHLAGGNAAVVILVMRGGQVLDRRELFWEGEGDVEPQRLLSELLPQVYERTPFLPKEVHLPVPIDDAEVVEQWLSQRKGERVYLRFPARGAKAGRVGLAMRNAQLAFRRRFRGHQEHVAGAEALARHLELPERPRRIEGLDVSHVQGTETVASLVVWEEGRMRKGDYRTFNVRGLAGGDDFAALHQAVSRRYRGLLDEDALLPDLVLIDGGRGQLNAALAGLAELGIEEVPVVALAKREEALYLAGRPEPLRLARRDPGLKILQQVRDEAHRFAVSRHRRRRGREALISKLDQLAGVGVRRRRLLLQRFGSLAGVRAASREDLQGLLGPALGASVYQQLREGMEVESPAQDPP
ncbi:MAG TPA: excinuclease ABC subunit UvrC [Thermoanaerobaculia bacterium]|nr:excinuclease ABC subunit UvrC [Thermoanaerobaculia bacterium]